MVVNGMLAVCEVFQGHVLPFICHITPMLNKYNLYQAHTSSMETQAAGSKGVVDNNGIIMWL